MRRREPPVFLGAVAGKADAVDPAVPRATTAAEDGLDPELAFGQAGVGFAEVPASHRRQVAGPGEGVAAAELCRLLGPCHRGGGCVE